MSDKEKVIFKKNHGFPEMGFLGWFIIFAIATIIIVIERYTKVYINSFYIRLFLYLILATLFSFWIAWILFGFKAITKRKLIFAIVVVLCFSKAYLTWGGDWKTQTILYSNIQNDCKQLNFKCGAIGLPLATENELWKEKKQCLS